MKKHLLSIRKLALLLLCLFSVQFTFAQTSISTSSLTQNQNEEGIMFDLLMKQNATLTSIEAALEDVGDYNFNIYYRTGTYVGNESSSTGWILFANTGTFNNSTAGAILDLPLGGATLPLSSGTTYGIYIENIDGNFEDLAMHADITTGDVAADNSLATLYTGEAINSGNDGSFSGVDETDRTFIGTLTFTPDGTTPAANLPGMNRWYLLLFGILLSGLAVYKVYGRV